MQLSEKIAEQKILQQAKRKQTTHQAVNKTKQMATTIGNKINFKRKNK